VLNLIFLFLLLLFGFFAGLFYLLELLENVVLFFGTILLLSHTESFPSRSKDCKSPVFSNFLSVQTAGISLLFLDFLLVRETGMLEDEVNACFVYPLLVELLQFIVAIVLYC